MWGFFSEQNQRVSRLEDTSLKWQQEHCAEERRGNEYMCGMLSAKTPQHHYFPSPHPSPSHSLPRTIRSTKPLSISQETGKSHKFQRKDPRDSSSRDSSLTAQLEPSKWSWDRPHPYLRTSSFLFYSLHMSRETRFARHLRKCFNTEDRDQNWQTSSRAEETYIIIRNKHRYCSHERRTRWIRVTIRERNKALGNEKHDSTSERKPKKLEK